MSAQIQDATWKVTSRVSHTIEKRTTSRGVIYFDGTVRTPYGIVEVLAETDWGFARVDFVWRGRHYSRSWHGRRVGKRGLIARARSFAARIALGRR